VKVVEKTEVGVVVAAMELEPFDGMELLDRGCSSKARRRW
jgi:hypothetical protein